MSIYLNILGFHIPSYGLMITLGVILANVFALYPLKKYKLIFDDFLILEAYTLLGAFIGAKLLYLIISYREIDWSRFLEPRYFNYIISCQVDLYSMVDSLADFSAFFLQENSIISTASLILHT